MVALLDSMAVIESHGLGCWGNFSQDWDIAITPEVRAECHYFRTASGECVPINLEESITTGLIAEYEPYFVDVKNLEWEMREGYRIALHPGECQSIAAVRTKPTEFVFCTSDRAALRSLGILGLRDNYIPFAEVFPMLPAENLVPRYTRAFCEKWVRIGISQRA